MKKGKWILWGFGWLIMAAAFVILLGVATQFLWNWLVPAIFNGTTITVYQAIGLILLGKLLTGFAFGRGHWHRGWGGPGRYYRMKHWRERFEHMSPEQREKFRSYYYHRCNCDWMENADEKSANAESTSTVS